MQEKAQGPDGVWRDAERYLEDYTVDYRRNGDHPRCIRKCKQFIAGIGSRKIRKYFRHYPGSNCPYAEDSPFTRSLKDVEWDAERGKELLREFCSDRNQAEAYRVLKAIFRLNYLHRNEYYKLCREAHARRIWSFSGIDLRSIPYVMACFRVVHCYVPEVEEQTPGVDHIRYSMQAILKLQKSGIRSVWEDPGSCHLRISFLNEDRPNREMSHSPIAVPDSDIERSRIYAGSRADQNDLVTTIGKFCCEKGLLHVQ